MPDTHSPESAARHWLANYYGSIDTTALLLAFKAGAAREREAIRSAAEALKAWREADVAVLECLKVPREERASRWDAIHTDAVNRRIDAVAALRVAVDEMKG